MTLLHCVLIADPGVLQGYETSKQIETQINYEVGGLLENQNTQVLTQDRAGLVPQTEYNAHKTKGLRLVGINRNKR